MAEDDRLIISLYCDDARHARGKVAHIGTILPFGNGSAARWFLVVSSKKRRTQGRRFITDYVDPSPEQPRGRAHHSISCPLCQRNPQLRDEQLQTLAQSWSDAQHDRVSLAELEADAAKLSSDS